MYDFAPLAQILPFLSQCLGDDAEILLCDTQHILYAEHPISDRVTPGNPLGDMERSFIEDGTAAKEPAVISYRAILPSGERLRASTHFLKHGDGTLAGFLTINIRVESFISARNLLDGLINGAVAQGQQPTPNATAKNSAVKRGSPPPPQMLGRYDQVYMAIDDIISTVVRQNLDAFGTSVQRLTTAERQHIVQELDQRGVFLVKGAVDEVAKLLACAEVTIYRYLQHNSH